MIILNIYYWDKTTGYYYPLLTLLAVNMNLLKTTHSVY